MNRPEPLKKLVFRQDQIDSLYQTGVDADQVTSNEVVYHYLNGDSKQFRTVVPFKDSHRSDHTLLTAQAEVLARDPSVTGVRYLNYQSKK